MECTLLVRRFEKGPVIGTFVFDVQDPVHRVKQMLLEQYGVPGLTVQEVVLEAELSCRFSLTDPCTLPLGDDRPIADLWWERWITHPFPKFQTPYLRLRRLHRENTAGEQEFLVYWRATVAFPGASRYINSIQYVTGSMSVRSLKHRICTVYNLTHFLDSGDYSDIVLYDFRDCRVFDETRTVEENGITPGSVLGLDKRCTIGWEGPAEAFPVTVMKEGPAEDVTVYVRPAERLTGVEERLWLLGHLTSNTKCPSDTKKGQELGFFSLTADERRNMSWTVIQLNIHPSTRLQLQWKPQQIRGPLIASIILKSDILSPSVLDTKSAVKDPVSGPSQPSSGKSDYDVDQMCEECNVQEAIPGINVIEPLILSECGTEFRITIPGEGWYQCHRTGLRWESTSAASIEYKYLSWKLAVSDLPSRGWIPASPLFDIRVLNGNIAGAMR